MPGEMTNSSIGNPRGVFVSVKLGPWWKRIFRRDRVTGATYGGSAMAKVGNLGYRCYLGSVPTRTRTYTFVDLMRFEDGKLVEFTWGEEREVGTDRVIRRYDNPFDMPIWVKPPDREEGEAPDARQP